MERLVEVVQRRAAERAQRFVGRTMEVLVEGTSRTDETKLRGRTRHGKAVNFDGVAEPGELVDVEIESATSQTLSGVLGAAPDPASLNVLAIFGPTGVGKTGVAIALAELLRERGEDPVAINCDALQVYEGLEMLTGAATRRGAGAAGAPAARLRPGHRGLLDRRLHAAGARGDRRGAGGGAAADRGRGDRPLPAGRARRPLAAESAARIARTRSSGRRRPGIRRRSSASTWTGRSSTSGSTPAPRRSSPAAPPRRPAAPTPSAPAAPPAKRSASTSCSPATSRR